MSPDIHYTWGLLNFRPQDRHGGAPAPDPHRGNPVDLINPPKGCPFAPQVQALHEDLYRPGSAPVSGGRGPYGRLLAAGERSAGREE